MENIEFVTDSNHAIEHIVERELNDFILKFGSFLSIINSKKINQTQFFIQAVNSKLLQDIIVEVSGLNTFEHFVREMMLRYPVLCKSKIVKNNICKKNVKRKQKKNI